MASRRTLSILFTLHSWAGIVSGLLLFAICFSGALLVFKHEIDRWANPSIQVAAPEQAAGVDAVLANIARARPGMQPEWIDLPDALQPAYLVVLRNAQGHPERLAVHPGDASVIGRVDSQLGQFIRMLHVFLFFGPRWIVGFLGVVMLLLIGTGVFMHTKILRELFTLRWGRSFRLIASDLHKMLGIWGLPFLVVIAFTGSWLGLAPVFERAAEFIGNDQPRIAAAHPTRMPAAADMASIDAMLARANAEIPGFAPRRISFRSYGRANAMVAMTGGLREHLANTAKISFHGTTGKLKEKHDPREQGFWSVFNGVMEPLHFGDFGGSWLKWMYFILGLAPAALALSGTLIWIDRRKHKEAASGQSRGASASGVEHA